MTDGTDFDRALDQAEASSPFRVPAELVLDADAYNRSNEIELGLQRLLSQRLLAEDDDDVTAESPLERSQQLAREMAELHRDHPPVEFVFVQLDSDTYFDLDGDHPGDRSPRDDFWLHLMAASCVQPAGGTVDGWRRWRSKLSAGQWEHLRRACEMANLGLFDLRPTRAATAILSGMRRSSTTAPPEESPGPDSSDG